jgi:hypothetical protein
MRLGTGKGYQTAIIKSRLGGITSTRIPFIKGPVILKWIGDRDPFTKLQPITVQLVPKLLVPREFLWYRSEVVPRLVLRIEGNPSYQNALDIATCNFGHLMKVSVERKTRNERVPTLGQETDMICSSENGRGLKPLFLRSLRIARTLDGVISAGWVWLSSAWACLQSSTAALEMIHPATFNICAGVCDMV